VVEEPSKFSANQVGVAANWRSPPTYPNHTNLLVVIDAEGKAKQVRTAAEWQRRREHILASMEQVMGPVPLQWRSLPLDFVPTRGPADRV